MINNLRLQYTAMQRCVFSVDLMDCELR